MVFKYLDNHWRVSIIASLICVGLIAAAGKGATELFPLSPADALRDPSERFRFDSGGQLRTRHRRQLWIQCGDQRLRQNSHVRGRWIHQAEIIGAGRVKSLLNHLRAEIVEDERGVLAKVRQRGGVWIGVAVLQRRLNGQMRQAGEVGVDAVDELIAEPLALLRVQCEVFVVKSHAGTCLFRCEILVATFAIDGDPNPSNRSPLLTQPK